MTSTGSSSRQFRPIYYLGCKTNFTAAIKTAIDAVDPSGGRLLDLFAGTGSVAAALGSSREVTTVDVQEYARVLCAARLSPSRLSATEISHTIASAYTDHTTQQILWCLQALIEHERHCIDVAVAGDCSALVELLEAPPLALRTAASTSAASRLTAASHEVQQRLQSSGLWQSPATTVVRYFGGLYFSFQQAAMLDALLAAAERTDDHRRDTLTAAALSSASQLVNTVGKQFAQPLQPRHKSGAVKSTLAKIVQRDRTLDTLAIYRAWLSQYTMLPHAIGKPHTRRQNYLEAIDGSTCSVIYADPPYTRDHYSRFYHVLETMCLRDNPAISHVIKDGQRAASRGVYRAARHQSAFCIQSTAAAAFDALFKTAQQHALPLVLSYSPHENGDGTHPRVVSMEQIIALARTYYERVDICSIDGASHSQLNRNGLKLKTREHAELLLKCFR